VRFAAPDTVAKVESWYNFPDSITSRIKRLEDDTEVVKSKKWPDPRWAESRIAANEKEIAAAKKNLADMRPNQLRRAQEELAGNEGNLVAVKAEIASGKARDLDRFEKEVENGNRAVAFYKKHLNDPIDAPLFSPEHHGIYDNYRETERYLKSIGGTDHVDKYGHRWIEVPVKGAKSPVKSGRVPMFSITGAAAPVGYNAVNEEPSK
jgi:hypothetical protein